MYQSSWYGDSNCCNWYGVTCEYDYYNNGTIDVKITEIDLENLSIYGPFPNELKDFEHLKRINFDSNELYGSIDSDFFNNMHNLERFLIPANALEEGTIPIPLKSMNNGHFTHFDISGNCFSTMLNTSSLADYNLTECWIDENNFDCTTFDNVCNDDNDACVNRQTNEYCSHSASYSSHDTSYSSSATLSASYSGSTPTKKRYYMCNKIDFNGRIVCKNCLNHNINACFIQKIKTKKKIKKVCSFI